MNIEYKEINFGNSVAFQVINPEYYMYIEKMIKQKYNIDISMNKSIKKYFKPLTNIELELLKKKRFLVYNNYNNVNIIYLYYVNINGINYSYFIYNKNIIKTNIYFNKENNIYNEFLFEGKILNNKFIINDIFIYNNFEINNFLDKLKIINNILLNNYIYEEIKDNYMLECDKFYDYKYIKSATNSNYGIIFRDIEFINKDKYIMNYIYNFNNPKFNLDNEIITNPNPLEKINKSISSNIILDINKEYIFKIIKTKDEDIYDLNFKGNNIGIVDVPDLKTSIFLKENFKKNKYIFLYFKCKYNIKTKRWTPFLLNLFNK